MATIANLDINLRARIDKLDGDFASARGKSKQFKNQVENDFDFVGKGLFGGGISVGTVLPTLTATAIAFGGIELGARAATAAIDGVRDAIQQIDDTTDAAHKLGASFSELIVLRRSLGETTGLGADEIDAAIQHMEVGLAEAAAGSGKLYDILTSVGMDAGQLMKLGPVEQMKTLLTIVGNMKNPVDQIGASVDIWGKKASAMVAAAREGVGHFEETEKRIRKAGLALTDAQAEQVGAANDAWAKITDLGTGAFRQIAAEVSPILTLMYNDVVQVGEGFSGWQVHLRDNVDSVVLLAGTIYDLAQYIPSIAIPTKLFNPLVEANLKVKHLVKDLGLLEDTKGTGQKWVDEIHQIREAATLAAEAARAKRGEESERAKFEAQQKVADAAKQAEEAQKKRIDDKVSSLQDELMLLEQIRDIQEAGFSKEDATARAKDAMELVKLNREKADDSQMRSAIEAQLEIRKLQDAQKALDQGKALKDSLATPKEQFDTQAAQARQLLAQGAIDQQTFERSIIAALEKATPAAGKSDQALLTANSREGWKFLHDAQVSERDKQLQKMEQQLELQRQQLLVAQEAKDAMKGIKTVGRAR